MCVCVSLCVCMNVYIYLSMYLNTYLFNYLSIYQEIKPTWCQSYRASVIINFMCQLDRAEVSRLNIVSEYFCENIHRWQ